MAHQSRTSLRRGSLFFCRSAWRRNQSGAPVGPKEAERSFRARRVLTRTRRGVETEDSNMPLPLKKRWLVVLSLVLLAALVGWRLWTRLGDSGRGAGRARGAPVVAFAEVARRDLEETFQTVGTVESPQKVELSPKVPGRIEELEVHPGDRVRQGQLLVRLDRAEFQQAVDERLARLAEARARLAQARLTQGPADALVASALRQQEAAVTTAEADVQQVRQTSQASIAAAAAELDNARAQLDNARARLERVEALYRQAFTAAQDVDDARTQASVAEGHLRAAQEGLRSARARATADVAAAEARLKQARAGLEHARASTAEKSAYVQNLSALQAVVEASQANLDSARSRLADTELLSPLDGYVTSRHLDPGALAQPGSSVLTLQSTRELWVTVPVPAEVRQRLEERTPVEVEVEGGTRVQARILRINAAADPESRQFEVRVLLPEGAPARPGMFARVHLQVDRVVQALAVPRSALWSTPEGARIAVLDAQGRVHLRAVRVGLTTPESAQILEGLQEGQKVVTLGGANLEDGQEVRLEDTGKARR